MTELNMHSHVETRQFAESNSETGNNIKTRVWLIIFVLFHIPLALILSKSGTLSTLHAILTLLAGIFIAMTTREPRKIAWVAAYIVGAEVLWRMTGANVFWEFGKYATIAVLFIGLIKTHRIKSAGLPVLFFILLTISIPMTILDLPMNDARQSISFNLSGPLSLAIAVLFFTQIALSSVDRERLTWLFIAPVMGIAVICVQSILTSENLRFTSESNFATSGGFGPNQVSAILGLGALLLVMVASQQNQMKKRWFPLLFGIALLTLSVLTFSRGGLYNFAAALLVFGIFSFRTSRARNSLALILIIGILIGGFIIYPQLNKFTGGMLESRFSDTDTSGRAEIASVEMDVFLQHPLLGVGPGMAAFITSSTLGVKAAAHTEYTRILTEHGIPGILAILIMLILAVKAVLKAPKGQSQAWTAALVVWPMVEMTHAAMRIAAIGFIFGLAATQWVVNHQSQTTKNAKINPSHRQLPH